MDSLVYSTTVVAIPQIATYTWLISAKAIGPAGTIPHVSLRLAIASVCSCLLGLPGLQYLLSRWEGS